MPHSGSIGHILRSFQRPSSKQLRNLNVETTLPDRIQSSSGRSRSQPAARVLSGSTRFHLQELSPEVIDAIARRAVEQLSEKVVQEIAWEVVPRPGGTFD